jgi:hypothetical protein
LLGTVDRGIAVLAVTRFTIIRIVSAIVVA